MPVIRLRVFALSLAASPRKGRSFDAVSPFAAAGASRPVENAAAEPGAAMPAATAAATVKAILTGRIPPIDGRLRGR